LAQAASFGSTGGKDAPLVTEFYAIQKLSATMPGPCRHLVSFATAFVTVAAATPDLGVASASSPALNSSALGPKVQEDVADQRLPHRWQLPLEAMHGDSASASGLTWNTSALGPMVQEDVALALGSNGALGDWVLALEEMHGQAALTSAPTAGSVKYLEYFDDEKAMEDGLHSLAMASNASILRTDLRVSGKRITRNVLESVMPPGAVLASCHRESPPETPSLRGAKTTRPRPFCHSPPTTTDMVYTLLEFEDGQRDWVMWACHRHNLAALKCHVTEVVAVDPLAILDAVRNAHDAR